MKTSSLSKCLWGAVQALLVMLLVACSGDPGKGPVQVKWDRDACERCRMVLSDRHYAAQVRIFPDGKRSKIFNFDDIGCAMLWLEDKSWKDDPGTEIWVKNYRNGNWIDARSAIYVKNRVTPMEYGLGAQPPDGTEGLSYAQAMEHVNTVEERFNAHGVQLLERLRRQAEERKAAR